MWALEDRMEMPARPWASRFVPQIFFNLFYRYSFFLSRLSFCRYSFFLSDIRLPFWQIFFFFYQIFVYLFCRYSFYFYPIFVYLFCRYSFFFYQILVLSFCRYSFFHQIFFYLFADILFFFIRYSFIFLQIFFFFFYQIFFFFFSDILFFFFQVFFFFKMCALRMTTIFIHFDRIFYFDILFFFDIFSCSSFTTKYLQCLVARLSDSQCFSFNYIIWKRSWMGSTVCSRYLFFLIWLILPVVICLFERLSHACLSINCWEYF